MVINFYGVRGSHPLADPQTVVYGGNTACVEVVKRNKKGVWVPLIVDGGTGLIKLGYGLAEKIRAGEYSKNFALLFTHFHTDHTEGFKFFAPNFMPDCAIWLMGMGTAGLQASEQNAGGVLAEGMMPPHFPINYDYFKCKKNPVVLKGGQKFYISQDGTPVSNTKNPLFEVTVMQAGASYHPLEGALYYRILDCGDGSSLVCVWDYESQNGDDSGVIQFAANADLLIHDTQYTEEEYADSAHPVKGFGHSTYRVAVENARKAGLKYLIPFHYNPRHSDAALKNIENQYKGKTGPCGFLMSREGLSLTVEGGVVIKQETFTSIFTK